MDTQDFRSLQEAYNQVYELDEGIGSAIKSLFGKKKEPEAQKPESRGAQLRARYNVGPEKSDTSAKRQILDRSRARAEKDEKEFGGSKYSKSVAQKSKAALDKYLKAGYSKYGADLPVSGGQGGSGGSGRGSKARKRAAALNREEFEYDAFDVVLEHLIAEGYADTNESALVIMANMSEEWRESIVEATVLAAKDGVAGAVQVKQTKTPGFLGTGIGSKTVSTPIPGTFTRNTPGRVQSGPRPFDAYGSGSKGAEAEMGDRSGPTDAERNRYNNAVTKNNTVGDKSVEPSPRAVNQRANQKGHSGLMPTRDNQNSTIYAKPNQSWRGY